tara:strand:+ start:1434 stop:2447 length:1014 start_codon:yes stop_codon:yes gene_type:complete
MSEILISRSSFNANVEYFGSIVGKEKICIALKDNAYGHGLDLMALLAIDAGIKHCFVKNELEALSALAYSFETVLVLYPEKYTILDDRVVYAINTIDNIDAIPSESKVELKIDTGMSRSGITINDISLVISKIHTNRLSLHGIFTHFASADSNPYFFTEQLNKFEKIVTSLQKTQAPNVRYHCCNTSATTTLQSDRFDLYRVGIGLYGYHPNLNPISELRPVMSVYADRISSRVLNKGDRVGYGSLGFEIEESAIVISNYDMGYGDGLPRLDQSNEFSFCHGSRVLGCISMDSFSTYGDSKRICVIEDADKLARYKNTISYEILTSMKAEIKRTIVE